MRGPTPKPPNYCAECHEFKKLVRGLCDACYRRLRRSKKIDVIPKPILPQELTNIQKEVLIGLLLGDGCLYRRSRRKLLLCFKVVGFAHNPLG